MKKFLIKVNGTQYEVEVEEVRDTSAAPAHPVKEVKTEVPRVAPAAPAPASAPKASAPKAENTTAAGTTTIVAPMPGTILKVNVSTGDTVKKGQVLLILEAMKMENEIVAPADGKIASVNVEKGKSVSVGDVMVSLA
jgi:glutaconyl-CoA/methylmalonyl-CoA decarboxylase subunit gamma